MPRAPRAASGAPERDAPGLKAPTRRADELPLSARQEPEVRGAANPGSWSRRALDTLEDLASALPDTCAAPADALHGELVVAFLQLAACALEDVRAGSDHLTRFERRIERGSPGAFGDVLRALRHALGEWLPAGAASGELCGVELSTTKLRQWLSWSRDLALEAGEAVDGPARELGALHELLLGIRLERLEHRAVCLRKSRTWIAPESILLWGPAVRAKRLQRDSASSKHTVDALRASLAEATTSTAVEAALASLVDKRVPARDKGRWVIQPSSDRRRSGAHYTPWTLCEEVARRALEPLVGSARRRGSRELLALRVCDPSMGAGAFLIAAAEYLSPELAAAWREEGGAPGAPSEAQIMKLARREIAKRVLFGVDKDPIAARLARLTVSLFAFDSLSHADDLADHLACGDALIGQSSTAPGPVSPASPRPTPASALDWPLAFPEVFGRDRPGFDAIVGNPPWVAYVGRAAQPLAAELARYYRATNPAFRRYRTLHGLFVYRAATLVRPGGRLALILPTSVADLEGYSPTRAAHDALCEVDPELPDWGDAAFSGVFQPCMALLSTRRRSPCNEPSVSLWPLENHDLSPSERGLLEQLARLPRLPPEQFGERGFQSTRDDQAYFSRTPSRGQVPLLEGSDVAEFQSQPARLFAAPDAFGQRLRPAADWRKVALWIRQTARFPIAARADGTAFRNSILAAFASAEYPPELLVAYLNSSLARWAHYWRHRDARQGMPQLKIGHLRALPALPRHRPDAIDALARLGAKLSEANRGISDPGRALLDQLVATAFGLSSAQRELVERWARAHPPPIPRRRPSAPAGDLAGPPPGTLEVAASP